MFLACGLFRSRLPWYVSKKYFDRYRRDTSRLPGASSGNPDPVEGDDPRVTKNGASRQGVRAHLADISFTDAMVGRVLRALETGPQARDTSVVLWGDHGWHQEATQDGSRFLLRERSTRNLLIMAVPGIASLQAHVGFPASVIDVYSTEMDTAGVRPPDGLKGLSLLPFL